MHSWLDLSVLAHTEQNSLQRWKYAYAGESVVKAQKTAQSWILLQLSYEQPA
jgi:hypothetical protein